MNNFPMLSTLIFLPTIAALICPFLPDDRGLLNRFAAGVSGLLFVLSVVFWFTSTQAGITPAEHLNWLPQLGIAYSVGADSISWVLVILTTFLVLMAVIASFTSIDKRPRLYYSMLFLLTTAVLGVFLARDMFLFFLFWELELIPMYLLIAIWGGPRREFAALKFVLYTLFGSIFMLAAILGLFFYTKAVIGYSTFDFAQLSLAHTYGLPLTAQILMFLGLFIAFSIKLPMVPFHTWLPDAHVEAPTPVSMLLAGILLKMGSYGLLRFCFGWFPEAAAVLAPYVVSLGVISILYAAAVTIAQEDLKKLIAYSSVSHMGFVLLGLGALNAVGFNGAFFQMISHGLISAGLFMMVGSIYTRTHTRSIAEIGGGFGKLMPALFFFSLVIALASLGLPLLAGFPAETLVFYGAYLSQAFAGIPWFGSVIPLSIQALTVLAAIGVVTGAAYVLWMLARIFKGPVVSKWQGTGDLVPSETLVFATLTFVIILFGFFPNWLSKQFEPQVTTMALPYNSLNEEAAKPAPQAPVVASSEAASAQRSR